MQSERNFPQHVATAYFTNVWLICKFFKNVHNCRQCCYLISSSASRGSIRCSFASALPLNTQQSLKTVNGVNTLWQCCNGQGIKLVILRSWVRFPAVPLSGNNLRQVSYIHTLICLRYQAIFYYHHTGTITQAQSRCPFGWEGNHNRCVVALTMYYGLK